VSAANRPTRDLLVEAALAVAPTLTARAAFGSSLER
jgi:hypothetical protein